MQNYALLDLLSFSCLLCSYYEKKHIFYCNRVQGRAQGRGRGLWSDSRFPYFPKLYLASPATSPLVLSNGVHALP